MFDVAGEDLDARRVPQIEAVDVKAVAPLREVGLAGVTRGRVVGKARGGDDPRPRPEHLERGLEADLDPGARDETDAPGQGCGLEALGVVELGALEAERVVEVMESGELDLADVAALGLVELARGTLPRLDRGGQRRGREDGSGPGHPDPGGRTRGAVLRLVAPPLPAPKRLHEVLLLIRLRSRDLPGGDQQGLPHLEGHFGQESAVLGDGLQQLGRAPHQVEIDDRLDPDGSPGVQAGPTHQPSRFARAARLVHPERA